jgi:protein TonB
MTSDSETQILPVVTLVLWLACLTVGIAGWWLPYSHPTPAPKQPEPVQAELIDVKISPPTQLPSPAASLQTPPPMNAFAAPQPVVQPAQSTAPPAAPTTQRLTFGQGEGDQPAPEYPIEAQLAGQHGVVIVRFTVDKNGNVTSAKAVSASPWPLLNQSAVRAVRETWHFTPGLARTYEVSIQFVLRQSP